MHINAKRMKRRINKAPATYIEPAAIYDPAELPAYMAITDYRERAEVLGLTIRRHGGKYSIEGGFLDSIGESKLYFDNLQALRAEVNSLWEIATETEIEAYIDNAGRYHERIAYPDSLI